jgi:preprotein translocase subunit SecG
VNTFITVVHVLVCLILIVVVLLQRGKGAEIGAVFGGGASSTVFGSRGAGNFFTRLTTGAAIIFMLTSLTLSFLASRSAQDTLFPDGVPEAEQPAAEPESKPEDSPFVEVPAVAEPQPESQSESAAPAAPAPQPGTGAPAEAPTP